jgi:hypothetical protein
LQQRHLVAEHQRAVDGNGLLVRKMRAQHVGRLGFPFELL